MSSLFDHDSLSTPRPRLWQRLRFAQLFQGWELGLLAVALPLLTLWVVLPRPVMPKRVPLPEVDRRVVEAAVALDRERAGQALSERLSFSVRRVGELVRRFGKASASEAPEVSSELRRAFHSALGEGETQPLLRLRALETQLFVDAVRRFEASGQSDPELLELGGNFAEKSQAANWLDDDGRLRFTEPELRALYRVRWTGLVDAQAHPDFKLGREELRLYYRALLEHPEGATPLEQDRTRLALVGALGRRDAEYPTALARGILLLRLGEPHRAALALTEHLNERPDGPHALSARNYLLRALAAARTEE